MSIRTQKGMEKSSHCINFRAKLQTITYRGHSILFLFIKPYVHMWQCACIRRTPTCECHKISLVVFVFSVTHRKTDQSGIEAAHCLKSSACFHKLINLGKNCNFRDWDPKNQSLLKKSLDARERETVDGVKAVKGSWRGRNTPQKKFKALCPPFQESLPFWSLALQDQP